MRSFAIIFILAMAASVSIGKEPSKSIRTLETPICERYKLIVVLTINEGFTTAPATAPVIWNSNAVSIHYKFLDVQTGSLVGSACKTHGSRAVFENFQLLDAELHGDRIVVLQKYQGTTLIVDAGSMTTAENRPRVVSNVIRDSDAFGPIILRGEIVHVDAESVRVRLESIGNMTIDKTANR